MRYLKINTFITFIIGSLIFITSCTRNTDDNFEHFFFRNGEADLSVEINGNIGSNTFILFLHGGPGGGSAAYNSGYFSVEMEKDYAVVYLDQRGNGASQGSYDTEALGVAEISDDIYQLTLFLKAKYGDEISIFLAGHSWGGYTSAHALVNTPIQEEVKGWIEMNGAYDFIKGEIAAIKLFQQIGQEEIDKQNNIEFWQGVLEEVNKIDTLNITNDEQNYLNSTGFDAESKIEVIQFQDSDQTPPYGLDSPDLSIASYASNSIGNIILNEDTRKNPLSDRLNEIEIPCLFLWGKYDFVVPPVLGECAYDLVNTSEKELVIFENSGHSPMSTEPIPFTQKVKDFIEQYK